METRSGRIDFPAHTGPHQLVLRLTFDRPVRKIDVAIAGYEARFVGSDNEIRTLEVSLSVSIGGTFEGFWEAPVVARLNLQDDASSTFTGWIDWLAFVELGPRPTGPSPAGPIPDLPVLEV